MSDAPKRQTFGRSSRILNAKEYSAVMRARLRIGGGLFIGHAMRRADSPNWRLGLIVPKKFEPDAVRRNALKRVWRDFFRRQLEDLDRLDRGHDLVVRLAAKPVAGTLKPLKQICLQDAKELLAKLRVQIR